MNKDEKNKAEAVNVAKLFQSFGYELHPGDIFYKVTDRNGESRWGWKVGEFTHSCHIDTTNFVALLFIDQKTYNTSIEYQDDLWLDSVMI
jgi:hypothetical protein